MAALIRPEAMPLIELASATMQTNSGAGLGTVTKWRSTTKAISATAVVNAGPRIVRQSNCMVTSHPSQNWGTQFDVFLQQRRDFWSCR